MRRLDRKHLFINILANIVSFAVTAGITFFLTRYIILTLGKEAFGFVGLSNSFINYSLIVTSALNAMASRFVSIKLFEDDKDAAQVYLSSVIISNVVIALILLIPAVSVLLFLDKIVSIPIELLPDVRILWALLCINFQISICVSIFSVAIFVKNKLYLNSIRLIEAQLLRTGILLFCFYCFPAHVWYIAIANISVTIYTFLYNLKYTKKFLPEIQVRISSFKFSAIKVLLAAGIWNSLNQLNFTLLEGFDLFFANLFISEAAMGLVAITKTIPVYFMQIYGVLAPAYRPKMYKLYAENDMSGLSDYVNRCNKLTIFILSIPIAGFIVFGGSFFQLWLPGENATLLWVLSLLTMAAVFSDTYTGILFDIYIVTNKLKLTSLIVFITGAINVIVVLFALKYTSWGLYAICGSSSLLTMVKSLTFNPLYAARCLKVKWSTFYQNILKGSLSLALIILIALIVSHVITIYSWGTLALAALITTGFGLLVNTLILLNATERSWVIISVLNRLSVLKK